MRRPRWYLAALPFLFGLGTYLFFTQSKYKTYFIELSGEIQVGVVILILSALLSLGIAAWLFVQQRAKAEQQQIRTNAAEDRRRFLRRLDHELKNPLTAMLAGLASLPPDESQKQNRHPQELTEADLGILQNVQNQTQRLSSVVGDLRKLADLESQPLEFAPVNLTQLLEDAFAQIQSQLGQLDEEQLQMRLALPTAWPPLPEILGDEDLLFLAVLNLLQNAAKFSQARGNIELNAFVDGSSVVIKVADTGPGIPHADLDFVWDELYRGKQTNDIEGSGLGLAFVRTIITRHKGHVSILSRPNEGTEVTIRLPINTT